MKNDTRKIAIACFIGGALFALVAKLIAPAWWWVGIVVGFPAGYLAFEFDGVVAAVRNVANQLSGELRKMGEEYRLLHRHNPLRRKLYLWRCATTLNVLSPAILLVWYLLWQYPPQDQQLYKAAVSILLVFMVVGSAGGLVLLRFQKIWDERYECLNNGDSYYIHRHRDYLLKANLVSIFVAWPIYLVFRYVIGRAPKWIPGILIYFWHAVVEVFKAIHSDKRLLCGTDGTLGGIFAYQLFDGLLFSVITCGIAGAGLGLLDYYLVHKYRPWWITANGAA